MRESTKNRLVELLWQQLIQKINSEWLGKYARFGTALTQVSSPINFAKALHQDMQEELYRRGIKVTVVNSLTIHHYFKQGGFSNRAKTGTLDLFCQYLGYERWSDFVVKNRELALHLPSKRLHHPDLILVPKHRDKAPPPRWTWLLLLLFAMGVCVYSVQCYTHSFSQTEKDFFRMRLEAANQLEFDLYQSVPNIADTVQLNQYFTKTGSARRGVLVNLFRAIRSSRELRMPGSGYEILDFHYLSKTGREVRIKTKEKWYILWYNPNTDKDVRLYDEVNEQEYIFIREENKWKIQTNIYEGKAEAIVD
ncbi:MAG: hypothetical protein AAFP19_10625 [Bacteroidota bacterium]